MSLGRDHLQRNKLRLEIMGIKRDYILAYSWTPRIAIVGVAAISTHPHGPKGFHSQQVKLVMFAINI